MTGKRSVRLQFYVGGWGSGILRENEAGKVGYGQKINELAYQAKDYKQYGASARQFTLKNDMTNVLVICC